MMQQEIDEVGDVKHYPLGTVYRKPGLCFRYGKAGTELKAGYTVFSNVRQEDLPYEGSLLLTDGINDLIWGNLSATGAKGTELGVAVVDVWPDQYCWIRRGKYEV